MEIGDVSDVDISQACGFCELILPGENSLAHSMNMSHSCGGNTKHAYLGLTI